MAKTEVNQSGIYPVLDRILVKPDNIEEVTEGGIVIPKTVTEEHMHAQQAGTLIAIGPDAYTHYVEIRESKQGKEQTKRGYSGIPAKIGDRVLFARYGGQVVYGKDGVEYRLLRDEDLNALIDNGVKLDNIQARKRLGK